MTNQMQGSDSVHLAGDEAGRTSVTGGVRAPCAEGPDRELLWRAAVAAGIDLAWSTNEDQSPRNRAGWQLWNPLEDDGDALRLAVKLRMNIRFDDPAAVSAGWAEGVRGAPTRDGTGPWFWKEWINDNDNTFAAARRAIVRAAAETT